MSAVADLRFEGNKRVKTQELTALVAALVVGKDYSERSLRRMLAFNLTPLYEERALLTVSFPSVNVTDLSPGKVSVMVTVDEGAPWTLGKVAISGDQLPLEEMQKAAKFPEGKPANWKLVTSGMETMKKFLKKDGYLGVAAIPERSYRKDEGLVDVTIRVQKGKQYLFGSLQLNGLSPAATNQSIKMWKIPEGEPLDGVYLDEYLRQLLKGPAKEAKSFSRVLKLRAGSTLVDVVVNFR